MQMTFNIPAALGVALATSVIGTLTASKVSGGLGPELRDLGARYAGAVQDGNLEAADKMLVGLSEGSVQAIKGAAVNAAASAITTSMLVLSFVALAGAVFAWVVIGRRRTPDHIEMTHAARV